ncbi:MAG: GGDEF domain-containing protein [Solirubrobacteraceae bacterium]|nr:GGDEF domain-containing protein [Solirubrobacteraceae bacterium]
MPDAATQPDGDDLAHIIGRRDVATVPWATIALCSLGVALASALRPAVEGVPDDLVIPLASVYGVVAFGIVLLQGTPVMRWLARQLPVYVGGSLLLVGVLCVLAVRDRGLATVFFAPAVLIAMYVGLVLPKRWSMSAIVVQLALAGLVHALKPTAALSDAIDLAALVVAGWSVGLLCRFAHGKAARIALLLSRSDVLTRTLNRRGFFEQFEAEIAEARSRREPVALLILDLDDFKRVNDEQGHAAGDELLRWVGSTFPGVVPERAAVGRLGGDEFGVAVRGITREEAIALGGDLRAAVAERIGASVGVATSEDPGTSSDDFMRVADAALYRSKSSDRQRVHQLIAGSTRADLHSALPTASDGGVRRVLTYGRLLRAGGPPERPAQSIHYGWLLRGGFWVMSAAGVIVVGGVALQGPANTWGDLVVLFGPIWILATFLSGFLFPGAEAVDPRKEPVAIGLSASFLFIGLSTVMLAGGGITAPITAGLFLKVLFDAVTLRRTTALRTTSVMVACWLLVIALGPSSSLWAVPYQAILFGCAFWLGRVGRAAFTDATRARLRIAHTDSLTGLRNRPGFEQGASRALELAKLEDRPFGLLAFDLDDFKQVNDTQGHTAGDELLRRVADATIDTFPTAHTVGRLGGDEYVVALELESPEHAMACAEALEDALRPFVGASVGWALLLDDGFELEPLMQAADQRSYRSKLQRPRTTRPGADVDADESDDPVAAA